MLWISPSGDYRLSPEKCIFTVFLRSVVYYLVLRLVLLLWNLDAMHLGVPGPRDTAEEGHVTSIWASPGLLGWSIWYILEAGLHKHTQNVPANYYLENIEIPSSLYIPIKHQAECVEEHVIQHSRSGAPWVANPKCLLCNRESSNGRPWSLWNTGRAGRERLQIVARLSC